jgi:hypothetical protein
MAPAGPMAPAHVRSLARLLDAAVRIPGTSMRVGLDPLLGLIPGLGDMAGGALSGYIILAAWQQGASPAVLWRMLGNVAVDSIVGAVPVAGDLFDAGWKANQRNVRLLETHLANPRGARRASRLVLAGVIALLVLLVVAAISLAVLAFRALLGLLS